MKNIIYMFFEWTLFIIGILLSTKNKMNLILPMAMLAIILKRPLKSIFDRRSLKVAFISSGLFFGLFTESFAIWANINLPYGERVLLNPYPLIDITLAFFWYGLFVIAWYILLKKYHYSYLEIFLLAGAYGLIFEQKGAYIPLLFSPGFLVALFIMSVYAIFPMLAYMVTKHRFPERKKTIFLIRYPLALLALASHVIIWGLFGQIYYPILGSLGYLEHLK